MPDAGSAFISTFLNLVASNVITQDNSYTSFNAWVEVEDTYTLEIGDLATVEVIV